MKKNAKKKKSTKKQPRVVPIQVLRERAEEIEAFLGERKEEIDAKIAERRGALLQQQAIVDTTKNVLAMALDRVRESEEEATVFQLELDQIIDEYKERIKLAQQRAKTRAAESLDVAKELTEKKEALKALRAEWKVKMRGYVDGRTRRKRAELSTLRRRIAAKEASAQRRKERGPLTAEEIQYGVVLSDLGTSAPAPETDSEPTEAPTE